MPISSNKRAIQRTTRFGRDVRRLPQDVQEEAFRIANQLAADIFDSALNVKQMTGFRGIYRVVVVRNYRMVFSLDDENIYLLRIRHRREIYRNLEI
ncbi:MAG: type II toxin-antitoxin system RelE/ParE family toxin [Acidobacteria bacterium]|nr:type II toxin-antitoxin system RelE/ParE family toxin [Acidobacteriota bacterium]